MQVAETDKIGVANRRSRRERSYVTRMLASLAAALLAVTLLARSPIGSGPDRVGWGPIVSTDRVELEPNRVLRASTARGGIATKISRAAEDPAQASIATDLGDLGPGDDEPKSARVRPMLARETVYDFVQSPPTIRGGLGAYYINIEYPEEAVKRGIEGRLVLKFVVGTDGLARDILVTQSLHPLCDSAAVRALRETRFVAGEQNGQKVSVRMRLPVRFKLVDPGARSTG